MKNLDKELTNKIQELMKRETERIAKKYFNKKKFKIVFTCCFLDKEGIPLRGKCNLVRNIIEYDEELFRVRNGEFLPPERAFNTIVHEVCHLGTRLSDGETGFKHHVLSILAKERANSKLFEEEINKIL
jgi:hypothetical protein